jgi:hypothetical protein
VLVELQPTATDGQSTDLAGDTGAVGRVTVSGKKGEPGLKTVQGYCFNCLSSFCQYH